MRVLVCHTNYRLRSGECGVVEREIELLRRHGHEVDLFAYDNEDAESEHGLKLMARSIYSPWTKKDLLAFLDGRSFDVAHIHNTWLMASPSLYPALWHLGLPVVKTIHNYRWLCPASTFYRDGRRCHDCVDKRGGVAHCVVHRCFRGSVTGSFAAAARLKLARDILRIYDRYIDALIVQNDFVKGLLVRAGIDESRMVMKGNFLDLKTAVAPSRGDYAIFYGRHEPSKGLETLLEAIERCGIPLRIFGQGSLTEWLRNEVDASARNGGRVTVAGHVPREELDRAIATSRAVVFPSEWYESYPLTIVEAMAFGKPVIASNLGGTATIVKDGVNGLLFPPGDSAALSACLERLWSDDSLQARLEAGARRTYEEEMSPAANYERLLAAYDLATRNRAAGAVTIR